jgi:hypothetical protein
VGVVVVVSEVVTVVVVGVVETEDVAVDVCEVVVVSEVVTVDVAEVVPDDVPVVEVVGLLVPVVVGVVTTHAWKPRCRYACVMSFIVAAATPHDSSFDTMYLLSEQANFSATPAGPRYSFTAVCIRFLATRQAAPSPLAEPSTALYATPFNVVSLHDAEPALMLYVVAQTSIRSLSAAICSSQSKPAFT